MLGNPLGGSSHEKALIASLNETPESRLTIIRKTLTAAEGGHIKSTHRLTAAIRKIILSVSEGATDAATIQICASFSARTRAIDPRRTSTQPEKIAESLASQIFADTPDRTTDGDEWDELPPLSQGEQTRLVDLQRPFQIFVTGQFVLRPGAAPRELITAALNGREFSMASLRTLHKHLTECFSAGGVCLSTGPLYSETTRILQSQGVIAAVDPTAATYDVWSELEERI